MNFGTLQTTRAGKNLLAKAQIGATLTFTRAEIGNGSLGTQNPLLLTALISPLHTLSLTGFKNLGDGTAAISTGFSNADYETGFYLREFGLYALDPDIGEILYCYGNAGDLAEYISSNSNGELIERKINIITIISDVENVQIAIGESLIYSTKFHLHDGNDEEKISSENIIFIDETGDLNSTNVKEAISEVSNKISDTSLAVLATGTATAITLSMPSITAYTPLMKVCFMATATNAASAKTINVSGLGALPFYKAGTTSAPSITANKIYNAVLSADGTCFFLQASAEGNAGVAHVLAGKTFSNDDDTGLIGTMANRAALAITPTDAEQNYPDGYYPGITVYARPVLSGNADPSHVLATKTFYADGYTKETGTIQSKGAATITPSDVVQTISAGQYLSGDQTILARPALTGDADEAHVLATRTFYKNTYTKKTGTIPSKGAATITPSNVNQTISAGQYLSGNQTIAGDADLIASNLPVGLNLFGVVGTKVVKKYASGLTYSSGGVLTISGLNFRPKYAIIRLDPPYSGTQHLVFLADSGFNLSSQLAYQIKISESLGITTYTASSRMTSDGFVTTNILYNSMQYTWEAFE